MARYVILPVPEEFTEDEAQDFVNWLTENTDLPAQQVMFATEFGRHYRGLNNEVLAVSGDKPSRLEDRYRRLVGPWAQIQPGEWYGYNQYRP